MDPATPVDSNGSTELEYEGALGRLRARGRDPLIIISIFAYALIVLMLYDHTSKTEKAITAMVREMRLSTCISATKEDQREAQYSNPASFCNRMAQ